MDVGKGGSVSYLTEEILAICCWKNYLIYLKHMQQQKAF